MWGVICLLIGVVIGAVGTLAVLYRLRFSDWGADGWVDG
jgi:hypothetical protein